MLRIIRVSLAPEISWGLLIDPGDGSILVNLAQRKEGRGSRRRSK